MASLAGDHAKCFRYLEKCVVSQIFLRSSQTLCMFTFHDAEQGIKLSWLLVFWVGFTKLAFRTSCVLSLRMPPASPRCCAPWTLGSLCTRASRNSGRPIKYLICRNSPRCKKPTQRLQLCCVLTWGRRCQPRRVPSLTEAAVSLLNTTLHWQTCFRLHSGLLGACCRLGVSRRCFIKLREHPWRLLCVSLLESWRHQRYAADYSRTPIHLGALLLALLWLHMDGDTSCVPHLRVFILLVIHALFYAPAATRGSD